jgi:hypothetical protein
MRRLSVSTVFNFMMEAIKTSTTCVRAKYVSWHMKEEDSVTNSVLVLARGRAITFRLAHYIRLAHYL